MKRLMATPSRGSRTRVVVILLLVIMAALPALADKAKSLYEKGRDAEARQNYEVAYDYYKQAFDLKPKELDYRIAYERTKLYAGAAHVNRGQVLRKAGKLQEALSEFEKAIKIDPSSFIAQQELRRTEDMINRSPEAPAAGSGSQKREEKDVREMAAPVQLKPISNTPITLRMVEDTKVIYETIGKLAGINVLFDPDYTSRRIKIELNAVTLSQALEIVALESKTFWRPVTPNTIYVASDTKTNRQQIEPQVLRTFYLSNLSGPTDMLDVANALRSVLEISRVQQLPSQNAIVVRGTTDQVLLAQKLIDDLDKPKPEVIVEIAIMQVQKDKLKQLGIQPPFTTGASPTITLQAPGTTTSSSTTSGTTSSSSTTNTGNLTLNDLANLDARDFAVTIPSMSVSMLMNDSTTKVIQNPSIRAQDGQKAVLKIGERYPIATGSFQPGIGGVGINPLVNTQFQYTDIGVNIEITPHVYPDNEVGLKVVMEVSSVINQTSIGGISQPIIGNRHIEQDIRLKDGQVNLVGGIMEHSDVKAISGLPWLSQIPVLKYLFGQEHTEHTDNEIVFALIPRVVRGTDVNDVNNRTVDIGTANNIEVRQVQPQISTTGQSSMPVATPPQQGAPTMPPPAQAPAPTAQTTPAVGGPILSFDPPTINQATGSTFMVNVALNGAQNVFSVPAQINYNPKLLQLVNVSDGNLLSRDGQAVALVHRDDPSIGSIQITATRPPGSGGVSGSGNVFTLTFMAKAPGEGTITLNPSMLRDPSMQATAVSGSQAVITIR